MGQGTNMFFNVISIVFLALTLLVGFMVLGVVTGAMEPVIFAPPATDIPPTQAVLPTLTPSPVPGMELTPATPGAESSS